MRVSKFVEAIDNREYVIANVTRPNVKDCHGVSIYFPYSVEEDENQQTKRLLGDAETGISKPTAGERWRQQSAKGTQWEN